MKKKRINPKAIKVSDIRAKAEHDAWLKEKRERDKYQKIRDAFKLKKYLLQAEEQVEIISQIEQQVNDYDAHRSMNRLFKFSGIPMSKKHLECQLRSARHSLVSSLAEIQWFKEMFANEYKMKIDEIDTYVDKTLREVIHYGNKKQSD